MGDRLQATHRRTGANHFSSSFHVSIEARTTNTGPASSTLSAFTIDLCGPAGCFGQVHLPAITTHSDGAPIIVTDQLVRISDKVALQAFIQPVIVDNHAVLVLRNGHTTVRALGIGPKPVCYEKDIPMAGMHGPHVSIVAATATDPAADSDSAVTAADATGLEVTIRVANPSPMEISFGECAFELQNAAGDVFAELTGTLDTRCGQFEAVLKGAAHKQVPLLAVAGEKNGATGARLVGKRCFGAGWCDETIRQIDTPLKGTLHVCAALSIPYEVREGQADGENDDEDRDGELEHASEKQPVEKPPVARVVEEPTTRAAAPKLWHGRFWRTPIS